MASRAAADEPAAKLPCDTDVTYLLLSNSDKPDADRRVPVDIVVMVVAVRGPSVVLGTRYTPDGQLQQLLSRALYGTPERPVHLWVIHDDVCFNSYAGDSYARALLGPDATVADYVAASLDPETGRFDEVKPSAVFVHKDAQVTVPLDHNDGSERPRPTLGAAARFLRAREYHYSAPRVIVRSTKANFTPLNPDLDDEYDNRAFVIPGLHDRGVVHCTGCIRHHLITPYNIEDDEDEEETANVIVIDGSDDEE